MSKISDQKAKIGNITCNIYRNGHSSKGIAIISYGFLSKPPDAENIFISKLIEKGYIVIVPHYTGTYSSEGFFDFDDCHKTILKTIDAVRKKKIKFSNGNINATKGKLICIGRSIGGMAALMALAESKYIDGAVAICSPTDFRKIGKHIYLLKPLWRIKARKSWRIKENTWKKTVAGKSKCNPIERCQELSGKNILLVHGTSDIAVPISHSQLMKKYLGKECKFIKLDGEGHVDFERASEEKLFNTITGWMDKCNRA